MGYIAHHAIVFTSSQKCAKKARKKAIEIFADHNLEECVSKLTVAHTNDTVSFLIAPDGSTEGWDTSDAGDEAREEFLDWFDRESHIDHEEMDDWFYGDYVLVRFGGDEPERCAIERRSHDSE